MCADDSKPGPGNSVVFLFPGCFSPLAPPPVLSPRPKYCQASHFQLVAGVMLSELGEVAHFPEDLLEPGAPGVQSSHSAPLEPWQKPTGMISSF